MGTQKIMRRDVMFYTVTKKKKNKNIEGDTLKVKFNTLPRAREYAWDLYNVDNLKSLVNSNGVILPIK
jgi:hypothetical protein